MNPVSALRPDSRRRPTSARGTWISLFAMLMMFIGPLISQSMPMDHKMGAMPMDMSMSMAMPEQGGHGDHSAHPGDSSGDSELHALWEKCGYCSLFFHCPALPQAVALAGAESQRPPVLFNLHPRQGHAGQAVFPGARSRAPPSLV
jgi:hypothetical protein